MNDNQSTTNQQSTTAASKVTKEEREAIFLRGVAEDLSRLKFPRIDNLNDSLRLIGYKIVPIEEK